MIPTPSNATISNLKLDWRKPFSYTLRKRPVAPLSILLEAVTMPPRTQQSQVCPSVTEPPKNIPSDAPLLIGLTRLLLEPQVYVCRCKCSASCKSLRVLFLAPSILRPQRGAVTSRAAGLEACVHRDGSDHQLGSLNSSTRLHLFESSPKIFRGFSSSRQT